MRYAYIGEIRLFAGNRAPSGWAICNGQPLSINNYQELYELIGTTYGGTPTAFNLPDLRGRTVVSSGTGAGLSTRSIGERGGKENITLSTEQMPQHTHPFNVSTASTGSTSTPGTNTFVGIPTSSDPSPVCYLPNSKGLVVQPLHDTAVANKGDGVKHNNMQPFLVINYIIALSGRFPTQG